MVSDTVGSVLPVSSSTVCSMSRTIRSPSSSRPWMNSQRGLSGTFFRTNQMPMPSTAPRPKVMPTDFGVDEGRVQQRDGEQRPRARRPPRTEPLIAMSIRPRYWAGMSSSMAELMAAYSPPMPAPVMARQAKYHVRFIENAVSTVPTR